MVEIISSKSQLKTHFTKMGKGGKHLQNTNQEIKELQDSLHELDNWVIDLHKQIDLKDKLIEALQLKLIENEQQIENMVDATCATNDLIQKVDALVTQMT
jgi:predicted  nucleic acid-binding Zn-ribbon protein